MKTSHVMQAMTVEKELADRTIRLSLGWSTTAGELDAFTDAWKSFA